MASSKRSISLSRELDQVLVRIARSRREERSRLIETLLREHPLVRDAIAEARAGAPTTKKGRDVAKLLLLARVARRAWERRAASGEVRIRAARP